MSSNSQIYGMYVRSDCVWEIEKCVYHISKPRCQDEHISLWVAMHVLHLKLEDLDSKSLQVAVGDQHSGSYSCKNVVSFKPCPSDHNISTQHIAPLLGAMIMLHAIGHPDVMCCDMLGVVGSNCRNTWQQGCTKLSTCYIQQCCGMLYYNVWIVWLGL